MYLVYLWTLTSNMRSYGTSESNSACTLYSSPESWTSGLDFLAWSFLPRFITAFYKFHLSIFIYHFYFCYLLFITTLIRAFDLLWTSIPRFITCLHWQTCMPLCQYDKKLMVSNYSCLSFLICRCAREIM